MSSECQMSRALITEQTKSDTVFNIVLFVLKHKDTNVILDLVTRLIMKQLRLLAFVVRSFQNGNCQEQMARLNLQ